MSRRCLLSNQTRPMRSFATLWLTRGFGAAGGAAQMTVARGVFGTGVQMPGERQGARAGRTGLDAIEHGLPSWQVYPATPSLGVSHSVANLCLGVV